MTNLMEWREYEKIIIPMFVKKDMEIIAVMELRKKETITGYGSDMELEHRGNM